MQLNDQLEDLLDKWQEAQALGATLNPAEFCEDTPELLPEFSRWLAVLNHFEALRADPDDLAPIPGGPSSARPPMQPAPPVGDSPSRTTALGDKIVPPPPAEGRERTGSRWGVSLMNEGLSGTGALSVALAQQVDAVCNRFEAAWRAGQRPRLEDYLGDVPAPAQAALLRELLGLEIDYRRRAGETPQAAEYHARFPDLTAVVHRVFHDPVAGHAAPVAGDETKEPVIPGYEILGELGRGGMAVVYRATNPLLQRDEALKIMLPEIAAKPQARERFLREARAMAALRHDHVVEVYRVGEVEDVPFLAMPLLEGETLATRLKREKTLPPAEAIRIGREMTEGLAAAHAKGLIHRDIKPGNVWLEAGTNRVKLLDFGLVRDQDSGSGLTREGAIVGTPAYMSPEQVNGEPVDTRSDLFSVGSVLYECATGRQAFAGPTMTAILAAVGQIQPPAARLVNPQVPAELSDLIDCLLHKIPAQRPSTAQDVSERLRGLTASGPEAGPAIPTTEYQPPRRWRSWLGLVAASCLIGLGLVGVRAYVGGWPFARPEPNGPGTTSDASTEPDSPPAAAERVRVLRIDVHHFEAIGNKDAKDRGLIGERSFATAVGDQVTVKATLSRPAYAYLIAFQPDGKAELCFPDGENEPPPLTDRPHYPSKDRTKRYGLTDGAGLMVFAVVASDRPLPAYKEWVARNPPKWGRAEGTPGEVWWDDGDLLDTLTPAGLVGGGRGKGEEALGRSVAVVRLTDSLKRGEQVDAVGSLGFVVRKR
jgi:serine/threonine protein kinase